jgi:hypothetical protein
MVITGTGETEILQMASDTVTGLALADVIIFSQTARLIGCKASTNQVLVDGELRLIGVAFAETATFGAVAPGCTGGFTNDAGLFSFRCLFGACVPVPGACPGDTCRVELCVEGTTHTITVTGTADEPTSELTIRACVRIRATTFRQTLVTVAPETNLCPEFPVPPTCPTSPTSPC